ncbi:hypothetical protein FEDK69T_05490 [Flavobacterium enshiense DK69]|nr:hypothetical protein FEDK69T_05490 [Flavobacterium enshiense DK69]
MQSTSRKHNIKGQQIQKHAEAEMGTSQTENLKCHVNLQKNEYAFDF